jgi:hypothetical protein
MRKQTGEYFRIGMKNPERRKYLIQTATQRVGREYHIGHSLSERQAFRLKLMLEMLVDTVIGCQHMKTYLIVSLGEYTEVKT